MGTLLDNIIAGLQNGTDPNSSPLIFSHDAGGSPGAIMKSSGNQTPSDGGDNLDKLKQLANFIGKLKDTWHDGDGNVSASEIQKEISGAKPNVIPAMEGVGLVGLLSLLGGKAGRNEAGLNMEQAAGGWQAGQQAKAAQEQNLLRFQLEQMKGNEAAKNGLLQALVKGGVQAALAKPEMPFSGSKMGVIDKRTGQVITPAPTAVKPAPTSTGALYNTALNDPDPAKRKAAQAVINKMNADKMKNSQNLGANYINRWITLQKYYPVNVIDTKNNNQQVTMNRASLADAMQKEPGRYIMDTAGNTAQALTKTATVQDIQDAITNTRQSITGLKTDFTPQQRAQIALVLKDRDPRSALSNFLGSDFAKTLTDDQVNYITDLVQLQENAMAMRGVLGAGQGSEQLRSAILRTVPGMLTPDKKYGLTQLDKFNQQLNRLSRGIIKVPLRNDTGKLTNTPARNITPVTNYLKGVKTQADLNARVQALRAKGWTDDEIKQAFGAAGVQ